jgi:hypothetical protein
MKITMTSRFIQGGTKTIAISEDEIKIVFGVGTTASALALAKWDGILPQAASSSTPAVRNASALCPNLRVGGFALVPDPGRFVANVEIEIYGLSFNPLDPSEQQKPINSKTSFLVENLF